MEAKIRSKFKGVCNIEKSSTSNGTMYTVHTRNVFCKVSDLHVIGIELGAKDIDVIMCGNASPYRGLVYCLYF